MTDLASRVEALNTAERAFLLDLFNGTGVGVADRKADKARQKCRKAGLALFNRDKWRWELTEDGQQSVAVIRSAFQHEYLAGLTRTGGPR